ncbi:DUF362 domain-containing protein [Thermodesulfobacteriota bacterium]
MNTKVAIVKGIKNPKEKEIRQMVEQSINLIGGIDDIISKGDRVLIKPNIAYEIKPGETEVSDPRAAKAIYDILLEMDTKPVIAESSAAGVNGEAAFTASGYYDLRDQGYEVVNLKKSKKTITIDNPKGKVLKKVKIWALAKEADVIVNLPVIKTHDHLPATLALKNIKGLLVDNEKKNFHHKYGLSQAIADLNIVIKPTLTIVDGIFCREGIGYPFSEEIEMDLILAGKDPVAVDTVTLMIMGIDPLKQEHAVLAEAHGIGTMNLNKIDVVGQNLSDVKRKFKSPEEALKKMLNLNDFKILSSDTTCTGCRGMMFYFLKSMFDHGKLSDLKEYTFIVGKNDSLPENIDKNKTVLVGLCMEPYKTHGRYVKGCPPFGSDVASAVFGEDVKQPYQD